MIRSAMAGTLAGALPPIGAGLRSDPAFASRPGSLRPGAAPLCPSSARHGRSAKRTVLCLLSYARRGAPPVALWRTRRIGAAAKRVSVRHGPAAASRSSTAQSAVLCDEHRYSCMLGIITSSTMAYSKLLLLCARMAAGERCLCGARCALQNTREEWFCLARPHR